MLLATIEESVKIETLALLTTALERRGAFRLYRQLKGRVNVVNARVYKVNAGTYRP